MNQPIFFLAADLGGVIFLIFAFISAISWVMNQVNSGKGKPAPRPQNRPGPRAQNPQIQREIDRFLREAAGKKRPADVQVDEIEIVQAPPSRRAPVSRKAVERPRPPAAVRRLQPERPRPIPPLSEHHLASSAPSAVSNEHLISRVASEHLPRDIAKSVSAHLGAFTAGQAGGSQVVRRGGERAAPILAALRTVEGVRSAIIMQEILQRPRALRRPAP